MLKRPMLFLLVLPLSVPLTCGGPSSVIRLIMLHTNMKWYTNKDKYVCIPRYVFTIQALAAKDEELKAIMAQMDEMSKSLC